MKKAYMTLTLILGAALSGLTSAGAHEAAVPHPHPHLHTADGAVLGFDMLGLVAIAFAVAAGALLFLRGSANDPR